MHKLMFTHTWTHVHVHAVIGSFMTVGIVFIAIAIAVLGASSGVLQVSEKYSDTCKESDPNVCEIKIKTSDDDGCALVLPALRECIYARAGCMHCKYVCVCVCE